MSPSITDNSFKNVAHYMFQQYIITDANYRRTYNLQGTIHLHGKIMYIEISARLFHSPTDDIILPWQ